MKNKNKIFYVSNILYAQIFENQITYMSYEMFWRESYI